MCGALGYELSFKRLPLIQSRKFPQSSFGSALTKAYRMGSAICVWHARHTMVSVLTLKRTTKSSICVQCTVCICICSRLKHPALNRTIFYPSIPCLLYLFIYLYIKIIEIYIVSLALVLPHQNTVFAMMLSYLCLARKSLGTTVWLWIRAFGK